MALLFVTCTSMTKEKKSDICGVLIPAGLLIGLGVGLMIHQVPGPMFIGLGVGFIGLFLGKLFIK